MDHSARHHCLIYRGSPSLQLPMIARLVVQKLKENNRCLYLNSPPMVAGMKSYLAAAGVDVAYEMSRRSLIMSAEQTHLVDGTRFSVDKLIEDLERAIEQAVKDGFAGLWATGDMTWELGPEVGSGKLLEYEWRLEKLFRKHPQLGGICQYHIDSLPGLVIRQGISSHPAVLVNETLSMVNPLYASPEAFTSLPDRARVEEFIERLAAS